MSLDLDSATKQLLNVSKGLLGVLVGMLAFLVVALPFFLIRSCDTAPGTNDSRRLERLTTLEGVLEQREELVTADFVDQEQGIVRLPIENAMAMVVEELQTKEVQDSGIPAEWIAPQMPEWTKSAPLYTLAVPEEMEDLVVEEVAPSEDPDDHESPAAGTDLPDPEETSLEEPGDGSGLPEDGANPLTTEEQPAADDARERDDMQAESANFGEQPVAGEELGPEHKDEPPLNPEQQQQIPLDEN